MKLKYFGIYQFFISPTPPFEEKNLLVSKVAAQSDELAINAYLENAHPDDENKREFLRGYLSAVETSKKHWEKDLSSDIKKNLKILGEWS